MDRGLTESTTEGGSSPDTVVAPSSSEDDRKNHPCTTSGEYVTVGAGSSSSLDTVTAVNKEKKKGRFGALRSTLRKESLFKIRKKSRDPSFADVDPERDAASAEKDVTRKRNQEYVEIDRRSPSPSSSLNKRKKKKSHSLVRKLSLNKFRLSTEQETRHTPEGGDSSRSHSQSSQDSPVHSGEGSSKRVLRKEQPQQHQNQLQCQGEKILPSSNRIEAEREVEKEKGKKKPEKLEKPVSTVTVVQRKSPSLTIKSTPRNTHEQQHQHRLQQDQLANDQQQQHDSRWVSERQQQQQQQHQRCTSTLPYAISKWSDQPTTDSGNEPLRKRLTIKADSESAATTPSPRSSPIELRRKLSLLEEKRAIFQRRLFDTTRDTESGETVIAVTLDDESRKFQNDSPEETTRKKARHISVRKFDTFSTFEGTFDEDTGLGYLAGIEEDYTESYDRQNEDLSTGFHRGNTMTPTVAAGEIEKTTPGRSVSQDSLTSQGNASNVGTAEKREHLYKILVIGELGAGKTSIIKRYVHQFFSQHYRATIGVDFALKVLNWDPHTIIRLQLWDIAGQERFGNMTRVYYKEAVGAFIVFDVTRSATLDAVIKWKQDLDSKVQLPDGSPIPCVLLANKCDQQKEGLVNSTSKMDEYCKEKNFSGWFETSAKENINIEEAARFLVNRILQNEQIMRGNGSQEQTDGERFALNQIPTTPRKTCSC